MPFGDGDRHYFRVLCGCHETDANFLSAADVSVDQFVILFHISCCADSVIYTANIVPNLLFHDNYPKKISVICIGLNPIV